MIGTFKSWFDRPNDVQTASLNATAIATGKAGELPLLGPVTQVLIVHFDGVREIRSVFKCGEAFFLWTIDDPTRVKRVLPYGRFAEGGPSTHIKTWEPFSDPDWQPDGAETACEKVRRLEAENEKLGAALGRVRKSLALIRNMAAEAFE